MIWAVTTISVICIIIFFIILKRRQDEVEENFKERFSGKKILCMDKSALYVARKSDGYSHFRGHGYLVLTEDELYFDRQLLRRTIIIPVSSIIEVDKTRRLAGQMLVRLMLKVTFKTQEGVEDAIAWKVKKLDEWITKISWLVRDRS
jgi:hypothetical protein